MSGWEDTKWEDPWRWRPYRRMRLGVNTGTALLIVALAAFLPAGWILMAPADPSLRPDLYTEPAWITLTCCVLLMFLALRISSRSRDGFEDLIANATLEARAKAAKQAIDLDIDIADTYPPIMLSRRFQKLCAAGPDCVIVGTEGVKIEVSAGNKSGDGPPYPHVVLRFASGEPDHLCIAPAASATSFKQVEALAEKLHDQLDPRQNWDQVEDKAVDMAAFIGSMKPKK